MRIFVGCSSRDDIPSKYYDNCKILLDRLFSNKYDLIFGACNKGLMGLAYNLALSNNSNIIGVYPEAYMDEAVGLVGLMEGVKTVNDRTDKIINKSDILLFLPGGIGTMYELLTAIESKRAIEHNKKIIIYNVDGFYDNFILQLDKMYSEKFISKEDFDNYCVLDNIDMIVEFISNI